MLPPIATEQSQKIERIANHTFQQMEGAVNSRLMVDLREQFFDQHWFFWDLAGAVASVATGQWIWLAPAWRHWEPAHRHLGAYK